MDDRTDARFANIDALRALAALLVLWAHAAGDFTLHGQSQGGEWLAEIADRLDLGRAGVVIFFCVSGYVIPATLAGRGWPPVRRFLINRFFRLYPLFWLSIPFGLFFGFRIWDRALPLSDILANFTMIPEFLGAVPVQGLYWTLETELVFYGACIGLHLAGVLDSKPAIRALCFALFAVMALYAAGQVFEWDSRIGLKAGMMAGNLSLMFFGSLCRKLAADKGDTTGVRWVASYAGLWFALVPLAGVLIAIFAGPVLIMNFFVPYPLGLTLFLAGAVLFASAPSWLAWLGCISYSVYLSHQIVVWAIEKAMESVAVAWPFVLHQHLALPVAVSGLVSVLVSWLGYTWIERPAMAAGRRMAGKRLDAPRRASEAVA